MGCLLLHLPYHSVLVNTLAVQIIFNMIFVVTWFEENAMSFFPTQKCKTVVYHVVQNEVCVFNILFVQILKMWENDYVCKMC